MNIEIPVDSGVLNQKTLLVLGIKPVIDFKTETQKVNKKTGAAKWRVQLLVDAPRKPEVIEIGFDSHDEPAFAQGDRPVFVDLVARHWENTNEYGTSSGVSLTADSVTFRSAPGREKAAA